MAAQSQRYGLRVRIERISLAGPAPSTEAEAKVMPNALSTSLSRTRAPRCRSPISGDLELVQIRRELKRVVNGHNGLGELAGRFIEHKWRFSACAGNHQNRDDERAAIRDADFARRFPSDEVMAPHLFA